MNQPPKEYLECSKDQTWRPCLNCGRSEIVQVRKALFTCVFCDQQYISTEKDMRPESYIVEGDD